MKPKSLRIQTTFDDEDDDEDLTTAMTIAITLSDGEQQHSTNTNISDTKTNTNNSHPPMFLSVPIKKSAEPSPPKDRTAMKSILERDILLTNQTNSTDSQGSINSRISSSSSSSTHCNNKITLASMSHRPKLSSPRQSQLLLKVLTCALLNHNDDDYYDGQQQQKQKKQQPYGNVSTKVDVCGEIVEVQGLKQHDQFHVGDVVVATNVSFPVDGISEYIVVDKSSVVPRPPEVDIVQASTISSGLLATQVMDYIDHDDRILIVSGADASVAHSLLSLMKHASLSSPRRELDNDDDEKKRTSQYTIPSPSFVVCVCSRRQQLLFLDDADEVFVNSSNTNGMMDRWWDITDYRLNKFNKVFDLTGSTSLERASHVLLDRTSGGRFITVMNEENEWKNHHHHHHHEQQTNNNNNKNNHLPFHTILSTQSLLQSNDKELKSKALELLRRGNLSMLLDSYSPLPFSEEGVEIDLALGRIVVKISD